MKLRAKVQRRTNGRFQAMIQDAHGRTVWRCAHDHVYGTSNRAKQDSASKCGYAEVLRMRATPAEGDAHGNTQSQTGA